MIPYHMHSSRCCMSSHQLTARLSNIDMEYSLVWCCICRCSLDNLNSWKKQKKFHGESCKGINNRFSITSRKWHENISSFHKCYNCLHLFWFKSNCFATSLMMSSMLHNMCFIVQLIHFPYTVLLLCTPWWITFSLFYKIKVVRNYCAQKPSGCQELNADSQFTRPFGDL